MLFIFNLLSLLVFQNSYFALSAPTEDVDLTDSTDDATLVVPLLQRRAQTSGEYLDLPAIANHMRAKHGFPIIEYERPEDSNQLQPRINFNLVEMFDDGPDISYYATLSVGTPPKKFNVLLDTGSSDIFLSSSICTKGCEKSVIYDPAKSRTSQVQGNSISLTFGSAKITGEVASDLALLGGFRVNPQTFVMASSILSGEIFSRQIHGLLGLGFQPFAKTGAVPLVESLVNSKRLKQPVMSFYFQRHLTDSSGSDVALGGNFTLGDFPSSVEHIEQHPIDVANLWAISLETVTAQGIPISVPSTSAKAIIDTGSTLIAAPSNVFNTVCQSLGGAPQTTGTHKGFCVIPCNLNPARMQMSFTFTGGQAWPLNPADLIYRQANNVCVSPMFDLLLNVQSAPAQPFSWIIGLAFLKNVYSVFEFSPPSVGFAPLPSVINPTQPHKKLVGGIRKRPPSPAPPGSSGSSLKSSSGSSSGGSGITGSISGSNSGTTSSGPKFPCINGKILGKFIC